MDKKWIKQYNNPKCILFFNGWGIDDNAIKHLSSNNYDICMLSNYTDLSNFDTTVFKTYTDLYLIAWSLGVWSAAKILESNNLSFTKTLAINGTLNPINKQEGIDPKVFNDTIKYWNDTVRIKFNRRILGGANAYKKLYTRLGNIPSKIQKSELEALYQQITKKQEIKNCFKKVVIGSQDTIFLQSNQIRYWQSMADYTILNMPHYPFDTFTSWDELLDL